MTNRGSLGGGIFGAALFLLLTAWNAKAADPIESAQTVQGLYGDCKDATMPSVRGAYCYGYIAGVGDLLKTLGDIPETKGVGVCGDVSYGAAVQAFNNYAAAHPEEWSLNRLVGVTKALQRLWPCNKASK
jgi:hypothetical protein